MSSESRFLDAMRARGLGPEKHDLVADGRLHRFHVEGDKRGSRNGWYVFNLTPFPSGVFGSWRTGESSVWRDKSDRPLSSTQEAEIRRQLHAARAARKEEEARVHAAARKKAERLLSVSGNAKADHPYLIKKRIKAWGIRQLRDALMIPARDANGQIHTLQFIAPDGVKRFLTGGRISGCYYAIGTPGDTILIAEGYATAATVFEATGFATAVAFNAGNLCSVARALRAKFPMVRIIICADNDLSTPGNPGLTKAMEAARAVRGLVAKPDFKLENA